MAPRYPHPALRVKIACKADLHPTHAHTAKRIFSTPPLMGLLNIILVVLCYFEILAIVYILTTYKSFLNWLMKLLWASFFFLTLENKCSHSTFMNITHFKR